MPNQYSLKTKEIEKNLPLIEKMLVDGFSVNEIVKKLERYSYSGIYNCIRKNGLSKYVSVSNIGKTRSHKIRMEKFEETHILTKTLLQKLYHEDKLTLKEIANLYGVSPSGVLWRMKKLGVNSRNTSEANYLLYEKCPELKEVHRKNANQGKTGVFAKGNYSNTWIEKAFQEFCDINHIPYIRSFQITKNTHRYDFLIGKNIIVELDGLYWHDKPKQKEKDKIQEEYANKNGYSVIRFTDKQIKESKGECFEFVRKLI